MFLKRSSLNLVNEKTRGVDTRLGCGGDERGAGFYSLLRWAQHRGYLNNNNSSSSSGVNSSEGGVLGPGPALTSIQGRSLISTNSIKVG